MEKELEAMLFAYGRPVKLNVLSKILEKPEKEIKEVLENMKQGYQDRGFELICIEDSYTLVTKKEYYDYIYKLFETRNKPNLSNAAFEVLAIIAYNTNITKAEVEKIRGVNSDGTINKLIEYELIEETGRLDVPGRPITYKVSDNFFKLFGYSSLEELPKIDLDKENKQNINVERIENVEKEKKESDVVVDNNVSSEENDIQENISNEEEK